jgi:hypothetical protein
MTAATASVGSALTDGTGISDITSSKLLKDLVADFLLTAVATLGTSQIFSLQDVLGAPQIAGLALGGAALHAIYRVVLKWATT